MAAALTGTRMVGPDESTQFLATTIGPGSTMGARQSLKDRQTGYLKPKFRVGGCRSDRVNYTNADKVFSSADIPSNVAVAKKEVVTSIRSDILGTKDPPWNQSIHLSQKTAAPNAAADLKRTLLKVRAGLMDQPAAASAIAKRTDEEIADSIRYITALTGKGPIGSMTKEWCNPIDERGLAAHCVEPDWPDWNQSTAVAMPEDVAVKQHRFEEEEARRIRMNVPSKKINTEKYKPPIKRTNEVTAEMSDIKQAHNDLKQEFKEELLEDFPQASEERLKALSHRLLMEKIASDQKLARYPVPHESFKPNLPTNSDRRYKEFFHPGKWGYSEADQQDCWSCCLNYKEDSKGCEYNIVNPDSWCYLNV